MKRKISALCLTVLLLLSLCACQGSTTVMTVSNTEISEGIFSYYLDKVIASPKKYGAKKDDRNSILSASELLCREYAAAISLMNENGIVLDTQKKQAIATDTENQWNLFSGYYESIGVKKTDITKVVSHEYRLIQLVDYFYGANGKKPVSEAELKEEFVDLYVGYKAISATLTKTNDSGETEKLSDKEKTQLINKFMSYASKINSGDSSIDEINISYNDSLGLITTEELEVSVVKKGSPIHSDSFYDKIFSLSHNRAAAITDGNTLYLVQRVTIATTEEDAFAQYRSDVLEEMRLPSVQKRIDSQVKKAEFNSKHGTMKRLYNTIADSK